MGLNRQTSACSWPLSPSLFLLFVAIWRNLWCTIFVEKYCAITAYRSSHSHHRRTTSQLDYLRATACMQICENRPGVDIWTTAGRRASASGREGMRWASERDGEKERRQKKVLFSRCDVTLIFPRYQSTTTLVPSMSLLILSTVARPRPAWLQ